MTPRFIQPRFIQPRLTPPHSAAFSPASLRRIKPHSASFTWMLQVATRGKAPPGGMGAARVLVIRDHWKNVGMGFMPSHVRHAACRGRANAYVLSRRCLWALCLRRTAITVTITVAFYGEPALLGSYC